LILNRDRHGANIEVLRNSRKKTFRMAPLFDHGLSLLCCCMNDCQVDAFDVMEDMNLPTSKKIWHIFCIMRLKRGFILNCRKEQIHGKRLYCWILL